MGLHNDARLDSAMEDVVACIDVIYNHAHRYMTDSKMLAAANQQMNNALDELGSCLSRLEQDMWDAEAALEDEYSRSAMLEEMLRDEGVTDIPN